MEKSKPKFTVALIARNEEKTLPKMIGSLKEFQERGGKVILLDTGSTDKTVQVAKELGCEVHEVGGKYLIEIDGRTAGLINDQFPEDKEGIVDEGDKIFDYSSSRNYLASLSPTEMVAMPDCDEAFTKLNIDEINKTIDEGIDQLEYNFVYSHGPEGEELIKFMHSKFYNRDKMKWVGIIHEVLQGEGKRKFLDESIIKLEHWQNPATDRKGYLPGLAFDCFMNPGNDRNAHYFGRELFYQGHYNAAIDQLHKHVDMKKWPTEAAESMRFIGKSWLALGHRMRAISAFIESYDMEPMRREPLMEIAEIYYKENKPDHVISYVAAALQIRQGDFYANFQPFYEAYPHEMMAWALFMKGEVHAAKDHFDTCIAYEPFNPKYLHLMQFYYKLPKMSFIIPTLGRPEGLKKCIDSIKALNYPQNRIEIIVLHDGEHTKFRHEGVMTYLSGERNGVPATLKLGVKASTGDWIVYASNDIEFTPDSIMIALKTSMDNYKDFMAFNTNDPKEGLVRECEHFMIKKSLIPKLGGEIFDTEFHHVGVDNLLKAKLEKLNQFMRCGRAIVKHNHFSITGEMDEVYKKGWEHEKEDRELLEKKLIELNK